MNNVDSSIDFELVLFVIIESSVFCVSEQLSFLLFLYIRRSNAWVFFFPVEEILRFFEYGVYVFSNKQISKEKHVDVK